MNHLRRSCIFFRRHPVLPPKTCSNGAMNTVYPFLFENKTGCILFQSVPRIFCTNEDRTNREKVAKDKELIIKVKKYLERNKDKFSDTELKVREKAQIIVEDIKATKKKVRESVENIIEKENIYTIPNFLCVLRIGLCPWLGILIFNDEYHFALGILGFAAVTDLLDGWIARTWESQSSKVGSFLDPVADKVLIATLFLSLTYTNLIPLALTSIIVARDVILIIAGFIIRYRSLPPPRTLSRYFDFSYATVQLAPTFISKVNTTIQLILVGSTLAAPVFQYVGHPLLECLWYITGVSTVAAGLSYVVSKNTYKYLGKKR